MDYTRLAQEFMGIMNQLRRRGPQKQISDSMHGEIFVLHYISQHEDNVIPSEISNEIGISTARVAATLNSLESKGLITRKIDVNDRRRILVEMTPSGKEQVEKHFQMIMNTTTKMLEYLGEQDAKEYVRIMRKLAERSPEDFM
jgi:MarR family transcriptional regulator, organic hydroperoxide resistance regulator